MNSMIEIFTALGGKLSDFGNNATSRRVIAEAIAENSWFSSDDIMRSVSAIREQMLQKELLESWVDKYKTSHRQPLNVAVIMAGNIPLVGLFDMMCVLICGHRALIKPSSKDSVLIRYIVDLLLEIDHNVALKYYNQSLSPDAVIATGSDNTNRYFRSKFGEIPSILRGNRYSAALLSGNETDAELALLGDDIFLYNGLGCRNVSHILLPTGYNTTRLTTILSQRAVINPKYRNNHRQQRAIRMVNNDTFTDGGFFTLFESPDQPATLSEITFSYYKDNSSALSWIDHNADKLQCVVCTTSSHPYCVPIGMAQHPSLTDYPDRIDVMKFLTEL